MTRAVEERSEPVPSGRTERAAARAVPAFIAGARECFERSGYVGTRIEDIASAANYAVGSFYTYFASKEEVLLAASRSTDPSQVSTSTLRPGAERAQLSDVIVQVDAHCGERGGLDAAMEQAALRSPTVLVEWRLGRATSVSTVSGLLRDADLGQSLSDDELAAVSSALLSMVEQRRRLDLGVGGEPVRGIWAAAVDAELVEVTPLTAAFDAPTAPVAAPPAAGSKARLLAAANTLFSTEAWESVAVARIAETAGVANGTFYRHFGSKAEVLGVLLDSAPSSLFPEVAKGDSMSFPDEVFHLVMSHFEGVHRSVGLWSSVAEAGHEPLVRDAVERARRRWAVSVTDVVRDWQRGGEVSSGVDVTAVSPALAAMLEREAFLVAVVQRTPEAIYDAAATVRDCWWRALTSR